MGNGNYWNVLFQADRASAAAPVAASEDSRPRMPSSSIALYALFMFKQTLEYLAKLYKEPVVLCLMCLRNKNFLKYVTL